MINGIKVSVIIPIYNVEKYIRKAIDSVVNQTLKDIEIICVNDCTPDNSMLIVEEFAKNDERFVIINQESNQGQGVARNRALDVARGEYIMFLDPDDWFELDACEKAYNQISKNQNQMVFFNLYSWKERGGRLGKRKLNTTRLKPFEEVKDNPHINLCELENNWLHASWTVLQIYSKDFLNRYNIRYSSDRFAEDVPFFVKACIYSTDISILDVPLYNYRKKIGVSVISYLEHAENFFTAKEKARKIIFESGLKDAFWGSYILYEVGSDALHFRNFAKANKKIRKDFFIRIKAKFEEISQEFPEKFLAQSASYKDFKLILECKSYEEYRFKRLIRKILRLN